MLPVIPVLQFIMQYVCAEFLPCLEKHGKTCHLLLSPEDTYFIQTTEDADGMRVIVRYANVRLILSGAFFNSKD